MFVSGGEKLRSARRGGRLSEKQPAGLRPKIMVPFKAVDARKRPSLVGGLFFWQRIDIAASDVPSSTRKMAGLRAPRRGGWRERP